MLAILVLLIHIKKRFVTRKDHDLCKNVISISLAVFFFQYQGEKKVKEFSGHDHVKVKTVCSVCILNIFCFMNRIQHNVQTLKIACTFIGDVYV